MKGMFAKPAADLVDGFIHSPNFDRYGGILKERIFCGHIQRQVQESEDH